MIERLRKLLRAAVTDPRGLARRAGIRARMARIRATNRTSRAPVTGTADAVVNLTSFAHRIAFVFYTLETIAAGSVRPRRLILWLDDADVVADPPPELRRLVARGLELLHTENYGPHKKQYSFALTQDDSGLPLVAADDDVLYDGDWLAGLLDAYAAHPESINGYRAHTIAVGDGALKHYSEWMARVGTTPSYAVMCTGVSGIIYPPGLIAALGSEGEAFRTAAPFADDVWVHAVGARHGYRSRQVVPRQREFPEIPGTQKGTLYRRNVKEGGNDVQIAASYGPLETALIVEDSVNGR